jgi:hypothetical protein
MKTKEEFNSKWTYTDAENCWQLIDGCGQSYALGVRKYRDRESHKERYLWGWNICEHGTNNLLAGGAEDSLVKAQSTSIDAFLSLTVDNSPIFWSKVPKKVSDDDDDYDTWVAEVLDFVLKVDTPRKKYLKQGYWVNIDDNQMTDDTWDNGFSIFSEPLGDVSLEDAQKVAVEKLREHLHTRAKLWAKLWEVKLPALSQN